MKLKLKLEDLAVDSFETVSNGAMQKGTVHGHGTLFEWTCRGTCVGNGYTCGCPGTTAPGFLTCDPWTYDPRAHTCEDNCAPGEMTQGPERECAY